MMSLIFISGATGACLGGVATLVLARNRVNAGS